MNRKYIIEMIYKYIYNDGLIVDIKSMELSYLENLLDFLINLDDRVNIKKHLFYNAMY